MLNDHVFGNHWQCVAKAQSEEAMLLYLDGSKPLQYTINILRTHSGNYMHIFGHLSACSVRDTS